jgi:hypothetical protein
MASQIVKRGIATASANLSASGAAAEAGHGGKKVSNNDCIIATIFHFFFTPIMCDKIFI